MNLTTNYLGFDLKSPFMPGASPLTDELDNVRQLEDAGASAIVLRSLFEEQIEAERFETMYRMNLYENSFSEAASFFPGRDDFVLDAEAYLEHVRKVKAAVHVPVIASLNGTKPAGWLHYAAQIEQAGADALELNVYHVSTSPHESASDIEQKILEVVRELRGTVKLPLAVKLSPFFTALPHLATRLVSAGARGLIVFNRFYQPDVDLEALDVLPRLHLSDSSELALRVRWLAILAGRSQASLAISGGVHDALDAAKAILAGASAVQMVSALLQRGPGYIKQVLHDLTRWMEVREYNSVNQMRGSLSLINCPDPAAFERGNYMRVLNSWPHRARGVTL